VAGYNLANPETIEFFIEGLPHSVVEDILRPPAPDTYETTKEKAIQSIKLRQVVENIFGPRRNDRSQRGDQQGWFQGQNQNQQNHNNRGSQNANWRQNSNPQLRYNSTTAPPSYANVPVPMDLDRLRASPRGGCPMTERESRARAKLPKPSKDRYKQYSLFPMWTDQTFRPQLSPMPSAGPKPSDGLDGTDSHPRQIPHRRHLHQCSTRRQSQRHQGILHGPHRRGEVPSI